MWLRFLPLVLLFACGAGYASTASSNCAITIESNDQVSWNTPTIEVDSHCKTFSITLTHTGKLDKAVMGHNWVLTKASDQQVVVHALLFHKATDYMKDDKWILAHSPLIGGGESTTFALDMALLKPDESYVYFCSYPEHAMLMGGQLKVVKKTSN